MIDRALRGRESDDGRLLYAFLQKSDPVLASNSASPSSSTIEGFKAGASLVRGFAVHERPGLIPSDPSSFDANCSSKNPIFCNIVPSQISVLGQKKDPKFRGLLW